MPALRDFRPAARGACDRHAGSAYEPGHSVVREPWRELSEAERAVAILAAAGWTNSAIAVRRGTSVRTTEAQLAAVLRKLVIGSRRDIVGFVPEHLVAQVRLEAARRAPRRRGRLHHRPQDQPVRR
ncbi:helix-turn-helix domain-containing protein [Nocardia sienata]|uniref:helix-turn-helix domain-containing protein n=1 Tax=Nocardia sienata TaxID=248552 RepID=UPI0007A4C33D|nr:helix-turn-helix transcriptional regulator [Nocardia sienata]